MQAADEKLLMQEVQELTGLMRDDPAWADLREALAAAGLSSSDVLLAGYMEDGEWNEWGVIVTTNSEAFEFERDTRPGAPLRFRKFVRVEDIEATIRDAYGALGVALKMTAENR